MQHCQYKPTTPATYYCDKCHTSLCDRYIDEGNHGKTAICLNCGAEARSLGASYNAEPFWRRFHEAFRYPLNTEAAILIIGIAFLMTAAVYLPFTIIWILMLTGAFMKYCFTCLEKTAKGSFKAPDITAAYEGGIVLALQLVALVFLIFGLIFVISLWLGPRFSTLIGVILIACLPAILINLALSEDIISALNPIKIIYLISAVGISYPLVLGIIMIMSASVGLINGLIGNHFSLVSMTLQSAVSNYYTIVIFHIMGYTLFQYQGRLGFIARADSDKAPKVRSASDRLLAKIEVATKEGLYEKATSLFQQGIKDYPDDKKIYAKCFEFILAIKDKQLIEDYAGVYFNFFRNTQRTDQLSHAYKRILQSHPRYVPESAQDRFTLAKACKNSGDSRSAVKLLNGLHKQFPNHRLLSQAYALMADALRDLPNMEAKADNVEALANKIANSQKQPKIPKRKNKAVQTKDEESKSIIEVIADTAQNNNDISYNNNIDPDEIK